MSKIQQQIQKALDSKHPQFYNTINNLRKVRNKRKTYRMTLMQTSKHGGISGYIEDYEYTL